MHKKINRVIVFGKPDGGKSTLSRKLSDSSGIKQSALDLIEFKNNGQRVSAEAYSSAHGNLIASEKWIVDGLGTLTSFWNRVDAADTLIYIDLPYIVHAAIKGIDCQARRMAGGQFTVARYVVQLEIFEAFTSILDT